MILREIADTDLQDLERAKRFKSLDATSKMQELFALVNFSIKLNGIKPIRVPQGKGIIIRKFSVCFALMFPLYLLSCSSKKPKEQNSVVDTVFSVRESFNPIGKQYSDTVWIKNKEEQFLLKVLTMLPDSAMGTSWKWSRQERKQMVNEGIERGYLINDSECCHRKKVKSRYNFFTTVIDGHWEMALFPINENNFIVITDEGVGDGNTYYAFELNNRDKLTAISVSQLIPRRIRRLFYKTPLLPSNEEDVSFYEKSGHESVFVDYLFLPDKIVAGIYLSKEDGQQKSKIYNGNRLDLNFNKKTKRFDIGRIYWQKEK